MATRRLLSIAHSYVVTLNRRLAQELARISHGRWEVTVVAPTYFQASNDIRPVSLELRDTDPYDLEPIRAFLTSRIHLFYYGSRLRTLLREGWDLVHSWEEPYILAGGQIAFWTPSRIPLVFWTAQNLSKRYPVPFRWIERYCLRRCSGWLACGQTTADTLVSRGYGSKPYRIMPLGVDVTHFRPDPVARTTLRRRFHWRSGPPVVGYLGRFVEEKGILHLTRVLDRLRCPWRALIVGGGKLEDELRTWAKPYGDSVCIQTQVTHEEVPSYLNAMDVLCAPSQTTPQWREQLGRMLLEGFACGVPVIGSDSGEIPHVLQGAGIVVGEKDEEGWARELTMLLADAGRRRELVAAGLERVHACYSWPVIARQHLDFFESILDGHSEKSCVSHADPAQVQW